MLKWYRGALTRATVSVLITVVPPVTILVTEFPVNVHVASAFDWPLPSKYEWIDAREVDDDGMPKGLAVPVLVPVGAKTQDDFAGLAHYEPLTRDTGLFLQIAALKPERELIVEFALKFGPLTLDGIWMPQDVDVPPSPNSPRLRPHKSRIDDSLGYVASVYSKQRLLQHGGVIGDSLDRWKRLIDRLGDLVHAWNTLQSSNVDQIASVFPNRKRHGKDELQLRSRDDKLIMAVDLGEVPSKPKLKASAKRLLLLAINEHLQGKFGFGLTVNDSADRSWFSIHPKSLEAAIWLQFAQAALGNKEFRECEACGTPFEVSLDAFRTNRTLCSSPCKARAHRMRRSKALAMAAEGKTAKQIAKQVNSKLETIEKWLEEREDE
jgi:hypothetical protein